MDQKHNITIRLGNRYSQTLKAVTANEEEIVRQAERGVNELWGTWCKRFPGKTPEEVMALVAYRFAELYYSCLDDINRGLADIENAGQQLDDILLSMDAPGPTEP